MGRKRNEIYFAWIENNQGKPIKLKTFSSADQAKEWVDQDSNDPPQGDNASEKPDLKSIASSDQGIDEKTRNSKIISDLLEQSVALSLSHREMTLVAAGFGPAYFSVVLKNEVIDKIIGDGTKIHSANSKVLYSYPVNKGSWIYKSIEKLDRTHLGLSVLPQSIFLGIIANFDSHFSDMVRMMLKIRPEPFQESEKTISLSKLAKASSVDDIINAAIDDEIYELMRGSHTDQIRYIEKNFHITITKDWKRWPDFIEIFERRNLVAHGEKLFTDRYCDICSKAGHKGVTKNLGLPVKVNQAYLFRTLDVTLEFVILLLFCFWRKHVDKDGEKPFLEVNSTIYNLIKNKRYTVASRVAEFVLLIKASGVTEATRRMIVINLASAQAHKNEFEPATKTLSQMDWSGCSAKYQLCVHSIKKELDIFLEALPNAVKSGAIKKEELREWPAFDFISSEKAFLDSFRDLFGEDFVSTEVIRRNSLPKDVPEDKNTLSSTANMRKKGQQVH